MLDESLSVKLQSTSLQESWGELINPYEFAQDLRDDFGGVVFSAYSTIYDRSDGRYRPVYETEMDLRRVRAMAWTLAETVPCAQAWINRLVDYTIGTGFDWSATSKENPQLAIAVKGWVDQVLENSNWSSGLERESFAREVADGEYVGQLEQSSGSCCLTTYEPDELTAPLRIRDLDEWLDLDFVSSWSFGVLTRQNRPAKHYGYHFVHDAAGNDWNFVKAEDAIFWRRNGRSNAKRGFSDFHRVFLHLARSNLVLTNTAEGAATQAAIAYIVEHAQTTSRGDIERMVGADSYVGSTPDPLTGVMARKKRMRPGTRIDTKGGKYQAGPLGTNNSQVYISVMEALLRIAGSVHAFPEGMLTGSYANNNFASSLTAEAPFVQGRMADQASRAMRVKTLLKRIVAVGHKFGVFKSFGEVSLEQIFGTVELSVIPSKIVHRDPKELTEALKMQKEAGWVSDKTAMTELGRDYDVEMENGAAGNNPEAPGQQQPLPGQQSGEDAAGAKPDGSAAVWMGLSRQQFLRNQKALNDILQGLEEKTIGRNRAKVLLRSIGMPEESIQLLMQDMVDGQLDVKLPPAEKLQESKKKTVRQSGCKSKRVASLRELYRQKRSARASLQESLLKESVFTPDTQPRGKDGKWIYSGIDTSGWPSSNSTAKACKASIKAMEKLVAFGKWDELEAVPTMVVDTYSQFESSKAQAKINLLKMKQADSTPKNAKPAGQDEAVLSGWKKISGSLGTEKGGLYIGPDGKKYYVKTPDNPARARNEVLASKLYKAANANVVSADLVEVDGKLSVATLWADDAAKIDWNSQEAKKAAAPDFAVHAWLNNWDAVGAGSENPMDNIKMIGGKPTLVDAGGSLDYSGMGGSGKKPFGGDIQEHNTLIDPKINPTMAKVFGGMTPQQRQDSFKKVIGVSDSQISFLVNKYHGGDEYEKTVMANTLISRKMQLAETYFAVDSMQKAADTIEPSQPVQSDIADSKKVAAEKKAAATKAAAEAVKAMKADALSKASLAGVALPPPPYIEAASKQSNNKVLSSMYELALNKDLDGLKSMKTTADAKDIYAQAKHKYKNQLIASIEAGSVPNPSHVVKEPSVVNAVAESKYKKLAPSDLPNKPTFVGSHGPENIKLLDKIDEHVGILNNIPADKTASIEKRVAYINNIGFTAASPKVKAYAKSVVDKLNGKAEKIGTSYTSKANVVAEEFAVGKTYARYFVHDVPSTPTKPLDSIKQTPSAKLKDKWVEGGKLWVGVTGAAEINSYTGGGYQSMNDSLKNKNPTPSAKKAVAACKAIARPVTEQVLSRTHANHFGDLKAGLEGYKKMIGHVIHDEGMLSTSADHVVFDYNTVHWKIKAGPHVRAAHAKHFSHFPSEDEIITAPKQKMRILHVEEGMYSGSKKIYIHAEFLPTEDSQWDV